MKKVANKAAIIVLGKEKLVDWLRKSDNNSILGTGYSLKAIRENSNIYLFDVVGFDEEVFEEFREKYKEIAEYEFNDWRPDSRIWPEIDSFEEFLEWFDYEYHCTLIQTTQSENQTTQTTSEPSRKI